MKHLLPVLSTGLFSLALLSACASTTGAPVSAKASTQREEPHAKNASAPRDEVKLPPGWTEADMQACMLAGTPGEMHAHLAEAAGTWEGKTSMWMAPGTEPMTSECTSTIKVAMDGRFTQCEMKGEMPGMGPYQGFGIYGFDNVAQKFVSVWIDNHGTGVMNGVGELSADRKTTTWRYTYNCPMTKKPGVMREVERITGPTTKTLEMFGTDPKSGVEYKMMHIDFTKKS